MLAESRALTVSHALAVGIGAGWLALVYLTPAPPPTIALLRPEEAASIDVQFDDPPPPPKQQAPPPEAASNMNEPPPTPVEKEKQRVAKEEAEIGDAFGGGSTNALVGDVTNALRGVEVAKGDKEGTRAGRKAVIAYGQGGVGARTPGKGFDAAAAAAASGIGRVNATGGVARASIRVAAPQIVARPGERPSRDMTQLGTFMRSRQAQLQFCYQEQGLLLNPGLAGTIGVEVALAPNGSVASARITQHTWTGAGVAETEGCILQRVRGWGFPASSAQGNETYSFSFVFNR